MASKIWVTAFPSPLGLDTGNERKVTAVAKLWLSAGRALWKPPLEVESILEGTSRLQTGLRGAQAALCPCAAQYPWVCVRCESCKISFQWSEEKAPLSLRYWEEWYVG